MKLYELTYTTDSPLSQEEQRSLSEKVILLLGAQPFKQSSSGSLNSVDFYADPEKIKEIEEKLKGEKEIKHFMLVKKSLTRHRLRVSKRTPFSPKIGKETEESKVELKNIEDKLDEILKD